MSKMMSSIKKIVMFYHVRLILQTSHWKIKVRFVTLNRNGDSTLNSSILSSSLKTKIRFNIWSLKINSYSNKRIKKLTTRTKHWDASYLEIWKYHTCMKMRFKEDTGWRNIQLDWLTYRTSSKYNTKIEKYDSISVYHFIKCKYSHINLNNFK